MAIMPVTDWATDTDLRETRPVKMVGGVPSWRAHGAHSTGAIEYGSRLPPTMRGAHEHNRGNR
jgi:hypothetical protein